MQTQRTGPVSVQSIQVRGEADQKRPETRPAFSRFRSERLAESIHGSRTEGTQSNWA